MKNKDILTELTIEEIINFAKANKLGEVVGINYRKNPCKNPGTASYEPYSIEVSFIGHAGIVRSYTFSKHGVANIYDGKRQAYSTDSEERFSTENPELHPLTLSWVKMLGSKGNQTYNAEEIEYRTKLHSKIDEKRKHFSALKSFYLNQMRSLEDINQTGTKAYTMAKQELEEYTRLCDSCSSLKKLHINCKKYLEAQLENQS